jgi:hypothetical protein
VTLGLACIRCQGAGVDGICVVSSEGKVVIEGDRLPEGSVVAVVAPGRDGTFTVPPELEQAARPGLPGAKRSRSKRSFEG